jgi:hypothetical protein
VYLGLPSELMATSRNAGILGVIVVALMAGFVPLSILAHRHSLSAAVLVATSLVFALVGVLVARHQPRNALGWLLVGQAGLFTLSTDADLYLRLRYRLGYNDLPLGHLAMLVQPAWVPAIVLLVFAVLLFPDGRLPSPRWRWIWRAELLFGAFTTFGAVALVLAAIIRHRIRVESGGDLSVFSHPTGVERWWVLATAPLFFLLLLSLLAWLATQIVSYRRSTGEHRLQLKWLLSGASIFVVSALIAQVLTNAHSESWQLVGDVAGIGNVALPVSMGVAILKFRMYEIDRLISRTLSYAIVTGLLVGVFVAVVTLTTGVLPFSSPVGVAASTLAAASLFNPLRRRVQHLVDRRFNRARYDAEATVAAFTTRLRDAVDLETVRNELLQAVDRAVEPAHVSLWIRPPESRLARGRTAL